MKRNLEKETGTYLAPLPIFDKPIRIHFHWIEENKRRDYDNIAFAKKFILDSLQKNGKLPNDNRKWVKGFSDDFEYGEKAGVIITISEEDMKGRTIITSTEKEATTRAKEILDGVSFRLSEKPSMLTWNFESKDTAQEYSQKFAELFAYVCRM